MGGGGGGRAGARRSATRREGKRPALAQIRERLVSESDPETLRRWRRRLREDARAGAAALALTLDRRLADSRRERLRLKRLFAMRRRLCADGARWVAGVDEVGVGPLAGPVVAAAVILPESFDPTPLTGLDDSKKLTRAARERLDEAIRAQALAVTVAEVTPDEIDRLNILRASLEAMRRAVAALDPRPDHVLVDARTIPGHEGAQTAVVGGDSLDGSIAAASIVAKVHRDALMRRLHDEHPGYGFERHMGYPTAEHFAALERLGASPIHRRSFAPVARVIAP